MHVWLFTIGEPIPQDSVDGRLLRTGQFADWLAKNGHQVTFFNSTVDHYNRLQRYDVTTTIKNCENYKIVCLLGRKYERSISLARVLSHKDVARSFRVWLKSTTEVPDVIMASYPIEELCRASLDYAEQKNIPVVIDCRDMWPDIFMEVLPKALRGLDKIFLARLYKKAQQTLSRANAISGMTKTFRNWGLNLAGRAKSKYDFVFPFTYSGARLLEKERKKIYKERSQSDILCLCFFGVISKRSGLDKFVRALGALNEQEKLKIELVICGVGDHLNTLKKLAVDLGAPVIFRGWVDRQVISHLMAESDYGLLPYHLPDFHASIPNKFVEYLAGELPILSCTEGEVRAFLAEEECGVWVEPDVDSIREMLSYLIQKSQKTCFARETSAAFHKHFEENAVFKKTEQKLLNLITAYNSAQEDV